MLALHARPDTEEEKVVSAADPRRNIDLLRQKMQDFAITTKLDHNLCRDLKAGFLLPYLLELDALTYGRWAYFLEAMEQQHLPERSIPQVDWLDCPNPRTRKMIETTLNTIPRYGSWQSLGGWEHFRYLLQWMLWGFGHPSYEEPAEPDGCQGASLRVYQTLNIGAWMLFPYDYLGDLLAENAYGRRQGFFPTPMSICRLVTEMLMGQEDCRTKTVCDPAVGTGRFLLTASNHSLRLYGQDIDPTVCMATLVNGYLFAPWLVKPFPFLDGDNLNPAQSAMISDSIAEATPPHIREELGETEFDTEAGFQFEPIKKRRRTKLAPEQGTLF